MMQATLAMPMTLELPPVKLFNVTPQLATPVLANADLTRDFIELSFQLESGRPLPFLPASMVRLRSTLHQASTRLASAISSNY